jgi:Na+(H+)/acetate symporter ActP
VEHRSIAIAEMQRDAIVLLVNALAPLGELAQAFTSAIGIATQFAGRSVKDSTPPAKQG